MINVWFFIFVFTIFLEVSSFDHNFHKKDINGYHSISYDKDIKTQIIRQPNGTMVTLECSISHCNHHRKHVKWEAKELDLNPTNDYKNRWRRIPSHQTEIIPCQGNEKISNIKVKIENNILYKCTVNKDIVKVYQIEIIDDGKPRVLEITPGNITAPINSQLILQCKVYSSIQPLQIFWFKQCDNCSDNVVYESTQYTRINIKDDASAVRIEKNVYISKLNIYKVGLLDYGVYACVGVNGNGFNVMTLSVRIQGLYNWEPYTSFSLLFLIPLAFALVPITVWLCYYRNRRKQHDRIVFQERKKFLMVNNPQIPVV